MCEVTVLMSVYNTPLEQLRQSLESILNQTYREFELLVIDDGSKNGEIELIESYKDKRIKIIKNERNLGLEKSLNKGLENAKGKYIVRMDTDDIAHVNRIDKQMNFIKKHSEYSIVSSRANYFNENGIYGNTKKVGEICIKDLLYGTPFIHPTMLIKKQDILEIGGYPLYRRCEDYAMVINMYANNHKGYILDEILLDYRLDKNNYNKKKFRDRLIETKMKWKELGKLKIGFIDRIIYSLKPIIAGIIPKCIMIRYHKIKLRG